MSGLFFVMDMLVDRCEMTVSLDELITGALEVRKEVGDGGEGDAAAATADERAWWCSQAKSHTVWRNCWRWAQCGEDFGERFAAVLSNHGALGGDWWRRPGLSLSTCRQRDKQHMKWLLGRLRELKPDVVVLARYMQILSSEIVAAFPSRIINIHPSLLPFFPGASPYRQAFESGARVTGCTAHFVTEQLDQGPIILQDVFHIKVGVDTAEEVREAAGCCWRRISWRRR